MNDVPLRDHITPHYVNLGLIKLPDIVKLYTCQLFYDHLIDNKPSNLNLSLVCEQHNYATRSASLQHLNPESFRINIRKFCPTILGCYYWNDIPLSIRNQPTRKLFTGDFKELQRITGVYKGLRGITGVYKKFHGITKDHTSMQGITGVCKGLQGYTKDYRGIKRITGVYKS